MLKVGIVGGTGYTGVELLRLLVHHPKVSVSVITSRSEAGMEVSELFPSLRGMVELKFVDPADAELDSCDVVFFATPNGIAMQQAKALLDAGVRVIDLAADFRLKDAATWEKWYGMPHACPQLLSEAVYGLPEINRDKIRQAQLIANPGCYPTAVQLGFLPLIEAGVVDAAHLIADAKSGVSGAGRGGGGGFGFSEVNENVQAYGVPRHNHIAEIEQELSRLANATVQVVFTPHLIPMTRGILATVYAPLAHDLSEEEALCLYDEAYSDAPFVRVLHEVFPQTKATLGSNYCDVTVKIDTRTRTAIAIAAIDNLGRGAAGQAVQNMNLMFHLPETTGLCFPGVFP